MSYQSSPFSIKNQCAQYLNVILYVIERKQNKYHCICISKKKGNTEYQLVKGCIVIIPISVVICLSELISKKKINLRKTLGYLNENCLVVSL